MSQNNRLSIGISTSFFGIPTRKDLEAVKNAGFECIEICAIDRWVTQPFSQTAEEWNDLAKGIKATGLQVWSVHLPYPAPYDICRLEPGMASEAVNLNREMMIAAGQSFHPQKYIIHASHEPVDLHNREERFKLARQSLLVLAETAEGLGSQLAVECLPRTCIGNDSDEIAALIEGNPTIGICCDTNHLLTERPEDFISKFPGKISSIHVSDYDGIDERHWLPGRGTNRWKAIMDALAQSRYTGPLMMEVRGRTAEEGYTLSEVKAAAEDLNKL